jgi:hypothetical protein
MSRVAKAASLAAAASMLLAACDGGTIHKTSKLDDIDILSIDARQRLVLRGTAPSGRPVVCAEPSPDAIVAQAATLAASGSGTGSLPAGGGTAASGSGSLASGYSESVGSIAMRTPMIQLMRDGYYRYCEALLNGVLNEQHYALSLRLVDMFLVTIMAIEALGGTVTAPPVVVTSNMGAKIGKEDELELKSSSETIKVEYKQPPTTANAEAIKTIVLNYLKLKARIIAEMSE